MTPRLEGWGPIAARLSEGLQLEVSVHQARRYASRERGALPVLRIGRGGKPRVAADLVALDAWAREETGSTRAVSRSTKQEET